MFIRFDDPGVILRGSLKDRDRFRCGFVVNPASTDAGLYVKKATVSGRFRVVDRGFEPLCHAWEACILTLRWIHRRIFVLQRYGLFSNLQNFLRFFSVRALLLRAGPFGKCVRSGRTAHKKRSNASQRWTFFISRGLRLLEIESIGKVFDPNDEHRRSNLSNESSLQPCRSTQPT